MYILSLVKNGNEWKIPFYEYNDALLFAKAELGAHSYMSIPIFKLGIFGILIHDSLNFAVIYSDAISGDKTHE